MTMTYIPQAGDIGLAQIGGPVGKLVEWGQQWVLRQDQKKYGNVQWTHAFVVLSDNVTLIEAEPFGARVRRLDEYAGHQLYWCENLSKDLTQDGRAAIAENAIQMAGTPYSFLDYMAIALHGENLNPPGLRNYIESTKHLICSQLADLAYDMAGIHLFNDGRWPGYVSPGDLYYADLQAGL